jgi:N-acyl-L-homoserine lactone synthetase
VYSVDPKHADELDGRLVRSVIGSGSFYHDRRHRDRLRIAFSDMVQAEVHSSNDKICSGELADLSSNGASVFLAQDTDLNRLRANPEELIIFMKGSPAYRKRIRRYSVVPVEARGQRILKLGMVFSRNVKATFDENDSALLRENRSVRLREKDLYPTVIRALTSEPDDVRFEVTRDSDVIERIYKLRYQTYLEEGKIQKSDFIDGRMMDKFDTASIHLCGRIAGEVVAAARIIPQNLTQEFEFEESVKIPGLKRPGVRYAEVSRFCVGRFFRNDVNRGLAVTLRLIGEVCRVGWISGIDAFLITAYKPHVRLYEAIGFRPVSGYVKLKGFHYEYVVMEWNIDPQKTAPLYRKFLTAIKNDTVGSA